MRQKVFLVLILFILLSGCQTMETHYQWQGIRSHGKWTLSVHDNSVGVLTLPLPFKAKIVGEAFVDNQGEWLFHCDELQLFYNHPLGWTDARFSLQGIIQLEKNMGAWNLKIIETPAMLSLTEAEIRYRREKFHQDRARDIVGRRFKRLEALAPFVNEILPVENQDFNTKKKGYWSKKWVKSLGSIILPELYGYSLSFDPQAEKDQERYSRNEGILWDRAYTREIFPEELWDIRNSGSLYRDYEEALPLLFLICCWDDLWNRYLPSCEIKENLQ